VRGDVTHFDRLVVVAGPDAATTTAGHDEIALVARLVPQLSGGHRIAIVTTAGERLRGLFPDSGKQQVEWIDTTDPVGWVTQDLREADLPLFVGTDTAHEALRQMPELINGRFLIGQAEQLESPATHAEAVVTGPVVTGRSLKPRHA
jgi:hypothetical protein